MRGSLYDSYRQNCLRTISRLDHSLDKRPPVNAYIRVRTPSLHGNKPLTCSGQGNKNTVLSHLQKCSDHLLRTIQQREDIKTLADPLKVETPNLDKRVNAFLTRMRASYQTFASIFNDLEAASFTAAHKVKEALPLARKLTAQLVYFSKMVEERPLEFTVQRNALLAELSKMRKTWDVAMPTPSESERRSAVLAW